LPRIDRRFAIVSMSRPAILAKATGAAARRAAPNNLSGETVANRPPHEEIFCVVHRSEAGKLAMKCRQAARIWIEQCEAARTIKARLWAQGGIWTMPWEEKLMNFADAATSIPHSPGSFLDLYRRSGACFRLTKYASISRDLNASSPNANADLSDLDEDDLHRESPATAAARVRHSRMIKELLTAATLGTSEQGGDFVGSFIHHAPQGRADRAEICSGYASTCRRRSGRVSWRPEPKPFIELRPASAGPRRANGDRDAFFWPTRTTSRLPRVMPV